MPKDKYEDDKPIKDAPRGIPVGDYGEEAAYEADMGRAKEKANQHKLRSTEDGAYSPSQETAEQHVNGPTVVKLGKPDPTKALTEALERELPELLRRAVMLAKVRRASYLALIEEGFTEEQALRLCVQ